MGNDNGSVIGNNNASGTINSIVDASSGDANGGGNIGITNVDDSDVGGSDVGVVCREGGEHKFGRNRVINFLISQLGPLKI